MAALGLRSRRLTTLAATLIVRVGSRYRIENSSVSLAGRPIPIEGSFETRALRSATPFRAAVGSGRRMVVSRGGHAGAG